MKRSLVTILAFLYLSFSSGMTLHLHYCMGQFINVSLTDTRDSACGGCGMKKHADNKGCCSNLAVTAKITDPHHGSDFHFSADPGYAFLSAPFATYGERLFTERRILYHYEAHAPPLRNHPALYLLNRNFRI